jgi:hypothetical protein
VWHCLEITKKQNEGKTKMETTKRQMRLEDVSAVNDLLNEIWALGDKDEMSIKHIGHGLASLITWGDWKRALDYDLPNVKMTKIKMQKLEQAWQGIKEWFHGVSKAEILSVVAYLEIASYAIVFLDVFDDYYITEETNA